MKRTPRTNEIHAKALTDARPSFVSLVKGGANQRPFRAVKSVSPEKAAEQTEKDSDMTKSVTAPEGYDISGLIFSKDVFKTAQSVTDWLTKGGYEGTEITETEKGFEVINTDVEFEEGTTEAVDGAVEGLKAYISKVKVEETAEKSEEEITSENATANTSDVQPVASKSAEPDPVIVDKEATSETAEKSDEITEEVVGDKIDLDGVTLTIKGMYETSVLSQVLVSLQYLVEDAEYIGTDEDTVKTIKKAAKQLVTALSSSMSDAVTNFEEAFRKIAEEQGLSGWKDATKTETKTETTDVTPEPTPEPTTEKSAEAVEGEVEPAKSEPESQVLSGLMDAISGLTDAVKGIAEGQKKIEEEVAQTKTEIEDRVKAVETTTQSRKGADVSHGGGEASEEPKAKADTERQAARRRMASALGHPDPSRV